MQKSAENIKLNLPDSKSLKDVMSLYEHQVGYPLITVDLTEDREPHLAIKQVNYVPI